MLGTIQSLWWGKLGKLEQLSAQSYLANGHPFHLYAYDEVIDVPDGVVVKDASEIVPKSDIQRFKYLAHFSDWFRYHLLLKRGGWWVDLDSVCLRPFDIKDEIVFSQEWHPDHVYFNNAYMKAPIGSPVIQWVLDRMCEKDWMNMRWTAVGPDAITEASKFFNIPGFPVASFNSVPCIEFVR